MSDSLDLRRVAGCLREVTRTLSVADAGFRPRPEEAVRACPGCFATAAQAQPLPFGRQLLYAYHSNLHVCACMQSRWAASDWVEVAQPVADFLYLMVTRFPEKRANRAAEVRARGHLGTVIMDCNLAPRATQCASTAVQRRMRRGLAGVRCKFLLCLRSSTWEPTISLAQCRLLGSSAPRLKAPSAGDAWEPTAPSGVSDSPLIPVGVPHAIRCASV